MITQLGTSTIGTQFGPFQFSAWYDGLSEAYSIHLGEIRGGENVPCRIHSSCITSHYFYGTSCDCLKQMAIAQDFIARAGLGIIIVLNQEAKGNGAIATANYEKFNAGTRSSVQVFQKMGLPGDNRHYRAAAFILKSLEVTSVKLLSNSRSKRAALESSGIVVTDLVTVKDDRPDLQQFYEGKRDIEDHIV